MTTYNDQAKARFPLMAALLLLPLAALFAPQAALAQCAPPTGTEAVPAPASGTVTCQPGDYADGIYYDSIGDLTLEVPDDTVDLTVNADGVNVTGNGADSVFWDSSAFISGDIVGTDGVVLDYSSGAGAIGIDIGGDIRAQGTATHAIRAVSGNGNVTVTTGGTVAGDQFGIQAQTGGAGALAVTASGAVNVDASTGVAAIDATTDTGLLTIDIASGSGTVHGRNGNAIRANAGGNAVIDIASGRTVRVNTGSTALDLTAANDITVNNGGSITITNNGTAIRANADTFTLNNSGSISNGLDLTADESTVNNTGSMSGIQAAGSNLTLNNDGSISGGTTDFSGLTGTYVFNNNAGASWSFGTNGAFLGTGTLNNAGTIVFGSDALVSAQGTSFTGTGDSLLGMRVVNAGRTAQTSCSAITVASCLDLTGGTTAGQTAIRIDGFISPDTPSFPLGLPAGVINPGIVLIDVSGGTSADEHFVLDPGSDITKGGEGVVAAYAEDPVYGAVLDTGGLFDYALLYNPNDQQHILASVPQHEALEYAALIHESLSIWHTTSDTVAGRQADLRDGGQRGGWVRVFADQTERDFKPSVTTHGNTFDYDRRYSLHTGGVIAGYDLTADDSHVLGVHLGFMSTELEHNDSETVDETRLPSSVAFGAYGGWWNETGLTLDGTLNANLLDIEHNVRDGLEDSRTNVISLGARAEAGFRAPLLGEALYLQPLANLAYVFADIENLTLRHYDAKFEDSQSLRSALGMRVGGKVAVQGGGNVGYWVTARRWEEHQGDGRVEFATGGDPLVIEDDLSGTFEEIGVGASLSNADDTLTGFFSASGKSADDLNDSYSISLGVRMNW